jgi:hypothetical protein
MSPNLFGKSPMFFEELSFEREGIFDLINLNIILNFMNTTFCKHISGDSAKLNDMQNFCNLISSVPTSDQSVYLLNFGNLKKNI